MTSKPQFPDWLPGFGIFILKSLGWIATAILVLFFASFFVRLPSNRADIFTLVEVLFGVIITALAIVASFAVSFNWGNLDSNLRKFTEASQKVGKQIEDQNGKLQGLRQDYTTLKEEYISLQGSIHSLIEEALRIKKFIEDLHVLDPSERPELTEADLINYQKARKEQLQKIETYLKGMVDNFEVDVRSIAEDVFEKKLKSIGIQKEDTSIESQSSTETDSKEETLP
jgi:hypothetical protein